MIFTRLWFALALVLGAWAQSSFASAPSITTKTLPNATVGTAYSQTLAVTGGVPPYTFALAAGGLPDGLSVNKNTGVVSGMPSVSGTWEYSYVDQAYITVTDSVGAQGARSYSLSILPAATTSYTLTVVNGSGGGSIASGATVTITANAAPAGQEFKSWTGATVANPLSASTTLVMPSANTTVTATYTNAPPPVTKYTLTVVNGSGGGSYAANASVSITANAAPSGQVFKGWTGATAANPLSASTTLVMPAANATVTATYAPATLPLAITAQTLPPAMMGSPYAQTLSATGGKPPYAWTISGGDLPDGLTLTTGGQIVGSAANEGSWIFSYPYRPYIVVTDSVGSTAAAAYGLTVIPSTNISYTLTVVNGSGGGSFLANATATITANSPGANQVFTGWTGATVANPAATTTTLVMPANNLTVTATYSNTIPVVNNPPATNTPPANPGAQATLTVDNGTGSGTFAVGAVVSIVADTAPAGQVFQQWIGAPVANPVSANTTLVIPANNVTVTATYGASPLPASIPQPVTTHPRLWITPADLPRLQSWAVATNIVYQQGIVPLLNQAISDYNTQFFPGGVANPNNPDLGDTQGYQGLITEQYALIFALQSLIDPSPAARMQYAQYARNLIMVPMNIAAQGPLSGAPFRDPLFPVYNRANSTSEAWPLVVDWIYNATNSSGQPILTATDKATIRTVFMLWATECLNASTTGGDHPSPVGVVNSTALIPGGDAYRMAANNYYLGHARLLTLMSLSFDPIDDPAINPSQPLSVQGNSLRSYINDATGAWLYQQFAMFGDHDAVCAAYGLPATASVGLASGGLPPEGMLYGHSFSFILGELLALKTAGFADTTLSGPQAALVDSPVWGRFVNGWISSLVPAQQVPPSETYLGPIYEFASYGDILRMYSTPDMGVPLGLLSMLDRQNGNLSNQNAERWYAINAVEGGAAALLSRIQNPWTWGVQDALVDFLLLDPTATTVDPHSIMPTAFYDAPAGRLVDRTDWSASATMFDFRCSWISINHQQADGNQFEFYRNGEWLTKGVANYDNNFNGLTTDYHNTMSLENWCANGSPANLGWFETNFWVNGSQWQLGDDAGDPVTMASVQPTYSFAFGDTTELYNRPSFWTPANAALDIQHASRSIIWLKPDHIVVYDRATSLHSGFKHFNLAVTAQPSLNGNVIETTTPGGQHLYVTSLLPANGSFSSVAIGNALNPQAELDPSTYRIVIEDPTNPANTRFLHVLQGANASVPADAATLIHSTSGTPMDGAIIGNTVVMFIYDSTQPLGTTSFTVPANANEHYVTGCTPGGYYNVVITNVAGGSAVTVSPAATGVQADAAGVLVF